VCVCVCVCVCVIFLILFISNLFIGIFKMFCNVNIYISFSEIFISLLFLFSLSYIAKYDVLNIPLKHF